MQNYEISNLVKSRKISYKRGSVDHLTLRISNLISKI